MIDIEQRLARDIEAVTKGVVVTESELLEARSDLDERIEGTHQRTRRTLAAIAAAAVVIAGGFVTYQALGESTDTAGPSALSPTASDPYLAGDLPTPELIAGLWREDNGATSMLFREDGSWQADMAGRVYSNPAVWGTYQINGDTITVAVIGGQPCTGTQFSMRASVLDGGNLGTLPPQYRAGVGCTPLPDGRRVWEHVLPPTGGFLTLTFSEDTGWRAVKDQVSLVGDWAAEGGGHVLEMTADGAYYVLDQSAEAVDQGRWAKTGSDLRLTSSAGSAECDQGDRLVLTNLQMVDSGTSVIRGSVAVNTCDARWTPKTWFLIPNGDH
jgi:hypothetical protein